MDKRKKTIVVASFINNNPSLFSNLSQKKPLVSDLDIKLAKLKANFIDK